MKTIIITTALVLGFGAMNAQKLKDADVPAAVKESVKKNYPTAKVEKWEKEDANYEAELEMNKTEMSVLLDASGKVLETEVEIKTSELPQAITDYITKNMKDKKIKEASKITDASGKVTYEAEVNDVDYIFDDAGKLLKKEQDSQKDGDKD